MAISSSLKRISPSLMASMWTLRQAKKDESYACKVGIIEFVLGIVILVADIFVVVLV